MSGNSYTDNCPRCDSEQFYCYTDTKPHDYISGECLDCGFCYWTTDAINTLEDVNSLRESFDLPKLDKLKEVSE
jgi:hypothetical protein